jgi:hypothetical protein
MPPRVLAPQQLHHLFAQEAGALLVLAAHGLHGRPDGVGDLALIEADDLTVPLADALHGT